MGSIAQVGRRHPYLQGRVHNLTRARARAFEQARSADDPLVATVYGRLAADITVLLRRAAAAGRLDPRVAR
jgi:hypothetical protein